MTLTAAQQAQQNNRVATGQYTFKISGIPTAPDLGLPPSAAEFAAVARERVELFSRRYQDVNIARMATVVREHFPDAGQIGFEARGDGDEPDVMPEEGWTRVPTTVHSADGELLVHAASEDAPPGFDDIMSNLSREADDIKPSHTLLADEDPRGLWEGDDYGVLDISGIAPALRVSDKERTEALQQLFAAERNHEMASKRALLDLLETKFEGEITQVSIRQDDEEPYALYFDSVTVDGEEIGSAEAMDEYELSEHAEDIATWVNDSNLSLRPVDQACGYYDEDGYEDTFAPSDVPSLAQLITEAP